MAATCVFVIATQTLMPPWGWPKMKMRKLLITIARNHAVQTKALLHIDFMMPRA